MNNSGIKFGEKVGYSLGDVGANLAFQMMMIYQLKFYTDVFGLDGAVAGLVLLVAPFLTAFVDPLVGIVADRTRTRWGKYRPWLLWTALPFCLFYILAFTHPGISNAGAVALYATVSYVLLLSVYSFNNTPYSSLGGVLTADIRERTSLNTIRFIASSVAQFVVQGLTLPLVSHFGDGNARRGWTLTVCLFALLAVACFLIAFGTTRERIAPPPHQRMSIRRDISETFTSGAWLSMFFLTLLLFVSLAVFGAGMNYYFQSYADPHSLAALLRRLGFHTTEGDAYSTGFSLFNTLNAVVQLLGVLLLSGRLADRFGKKTTFVACLSLTALFTALLYLPGVSDVALVYVLGILKSACYAPTIPLLWAMIADVADDMEYRNHRRATGFCFSGIVFALKMGLGLGGALAGVVISCFGYQSGGVVVQTASAAYGIRLVSSLIPALLLVVGVVVLSRYPITKKYNENMQAELAARRNAARRY